MPAVATLFQTFFDVCRLRLGPQDLPASPALLGVCAALYAALSFGSACLGLPIMSAFITAVLDIGMLSAFAAGSLVLLNYRQRIVQTLTALMGSGIVLGIFALPIAWWAYAARAMTASSSIPQLFWLVILTWNLIVMAHILRHALSIRFPLGLGLSALYFFVTLQIAWQVVPDPATT